MGHRKQKQEYPTKGEEEQIGFRDEGRGGSQHSRPWSRSSNVLSGLRPLGIALEGMKIQAYMETAGGICWLMKGRPSFLLVSEIDNFE